jgi:hypothetical protein
MNPRAKAAHSAHSAAAAAGFPTLSKMAIGHEYAPPSQYHELFGKG